jgi:hypothetical protein
MNPERLNADALVEASNDNIAEQREIHNVLQSTLSPEAMRMIDELVLVDSWEEFNARIAALNEMPKETQLNYAEPEVAARLEEEKLAERQMSARLDFLRGWKLGIERAKNGKYTFSAIA